MTNIRSGTTIGRSFELPRTCRWKRQYKSNLIQAKIQKFTQILSFFLQIFALCAFLHCLVPLKEKILGKSSEKQNGNFKWNFPLSVGHNFHPPFFPICFSDSFPYFEASEFSGWVDMKVERRLVIQKDEKNFVQNSKLRKQPSYKSFFKLSSECYFCGRLIAFDEKGNEIFCMKKIFWKFLLYIDECCVEMGFSSSCVNLYKS